MVVDLGWLIIPVVIQPVLKSVDGGCFDNYVSVFVGRVAPVLHCLGSNESREGFSEVNNKIFPLLDHMDPQALWWLSVGKFGFFSLSG